MRVAQKKKAVDFVNLLTQVHDEIKRQITQRNYNIAMDLLAQCQDGAINLCDFIQNIEGEKAASVSFLIDYYQQIYLIYEELKSGVETRAEAVFEKLQSYLAPIKRSIENDIKAKLEIAFLPYKASMWDSLESVWMAADEDPDCSAYVIPIPYYDRNSDGTLGACHYEGNDMPEYVPITHYEAYRLSDRKPDIIYIHNPYDQDNFVTTVDPRYYSSELKKHTSLLVYISYYITSGGMSEGQSLCRAYLNADYIVVQAEKYKYFFDQRIPQEKLLPFGSPKADKVIRLCQNPPEVPEIWKRKMAGRKVYFYNTSLNGMLEDTRRFLLKMEYVFNCFRGRCDVCLLWRPHPLMDSTFESMRKEYQPFYNRLKQSFIENNLGIFDDTPDITKVIALCDAYIGDSQTSVTALFGIAGKPIFILNNYINKLPEANDWRGEIIKGFFLDGQDEWMITQGNKLYHSPGHDYHYEFYCDLLEYSAGDYYSRAIEINGNVYVCPKNSLDILIISEHKIVKKIKLNQCIEQMGAFITALHIGNYLFLIPFKYPAIVRYDVVTDSLDYIEGYHDIFIKNVQYRKRIGGVCIWRDYLLLASPTDDKVLAIECAGLKVKLFSIGATQGEGCRYMIPYEDGICILPYKGTTITCWDPISGMVKRYSCMPERFQCRDWEHPFYLPAIYENSIILPPIGGNMFVLIDMETGSAKKWEPPFDILKGEKSGYFISLCVGAFLRRTDALGTGTYRFYHDERRCLYDINLETKEMKEIEIVFDEKELIKHEPGFGRISDWLKYGCEEKALFSLNDFLSGANKGKCFNREKQIEAFSEIIANNDGTCGKKIHQFACKKII